MLFSLGGLQNFEKLITLMHPWVDWFEMVDESWVATQGHMTPV